LVLEALKSHHFTRSKTKTVNPWSCKELTVLIFPLSDVKKSATTEKRSYCIAQTGKKKAMIASLYGKNPVPVVGCRRVGKDGDHGPG